MSEGKRAVKCPRCKYEWETSSRMMYVPCPNCRYKFNLEKNLTISKNLEHFNLDESGVKILDRSLVSKNSPDGRIIDVYFKNGKAWCEHDESESCKHVEYALSLQVVQKIFEKKGWKV